MIFYRKLSPIKALTFDLDDTFYDNHPYIIEAEKTLFEHLFTNFPKTKDVGRDGWFAGRRQAIKSNPLLKHDMILLRREVLKLVFEQIGLEGDELQTAIDDAFDVFYLKRSDFTVREDYLQLLDRLRQKVPLVAITNGNADLEKIGIAPYFDAALHASVEQPQKPDPLMFNKACELLNLQPLEVMHVGDSLEKDIGGALNVGMQTAWYAENRPMDLRNERCTQLPHVQLSELAELLKLLEA